MHEPPVYMSSSTVARTVGVTRAAVWNAVDRGSLRAAAYVDDTPVFTDREITEWRETRYQHRSPKCR